MWEQLLYIYPDTSITFHISSLFAGPGLAPRAPNSNQTSLKSVTGREAKADRK